MRFVLILVCLIASISHARASEPSVEVMAAPGNGEPWAARVDQSGRVHLVMNSTQGPLYSFSVDHGTTFSKPISIVDEKSQQPGLEFLVWDVAVTKEGRVYVAMGTNAWKLKLPKEEWGYFLATLNPGDAAFSPTRNINHVPSEGFSIAASDDGTLTACWLADKLYVSTSKDHGATFSPSRELSSEFNPCNCCTTSCVYGADGRLAILYREETDNNRDMYVVLWDQKTDQTKRHRVGRTGWNVDACPMTYYSIAAAGEFYDVVWPTKKAIYFSRLNSSGKTVSGEEILTKGQTGMRTGMMSLRSTDGSTLVAWANDNQVGWQAFDQHDHSTNVFGTERSRGKGVAGFIRPDATFVLFR